MLGKYVSAVNDEGEDESKIESYRDVVLPAARPVETSPYLLTTFTPVEV
ncbi:MAG: hypothetical protein ACLSFW_13155 [Bacteroides cellulosilyticus]